jgi:hypothetical protein
MIVQKCCNSTSVASVAKNTARESSILSARINVNQRLFAENTINNLDNGWVLPLGYFVVFLPLAMSRPRGAE